MLAKRAPSPENSRLRCAKAWKTVLLVTLSEDIRVTRLPLES
jgi:hypothetical protein